MINLELTPEQTMLQEVARRYVTEQYSFTRREAILASATGEDKDVWRDFATMGWLALPFPEVYGGAGGSMLDVLLLMQEFGRGLVSEPYLSTVVLGGLTVLACGTEQQRHAILPGLIAGELKLAFGMAEPRAGYDLNDIRTTARPEGNGYRLTGHKAVVLGARSADRLIISARTGGAQRDAEGISLFLVAATSPGIRLRSYATIDGRQAAEVLLDDVRVTDADLLGPPDTAAAALQEAAMGGTVAVIGEAVGAMDAAIAQTVSYLNLREQFGRRLATFQALRHRVADMFVLQREAAALALLAARSFEPSGHADRAEAVAAAKAYVGEEGRRVAEEAVQLHGAIAITDEFVVGHYLKRMIAIDRLFGDVDHHLDQVIRSGKTFAQV
jgi:alkylation response protein AidB-like acyl-CoA dehydrogenase